MTAARDLTRTIRQRISEGAPLDALAQELARQQALLDELAEQLRVLRAQRVLRDVLLPQAQVSYKGLSVARIEAGMPLDTRRGFYSLEYDEHGQPFRWTGPAPSFHFDMHLDRTAPLRFRLVLAAGMGEALNEIRAFCDGAELPLDLQESTRTAEFSAVLLPRESLGLTRLSFMPYEMFQPKSPGGETTDHRLLGVVFRELTLMPTSDEDAQAYLRSCDDLTQLMLTGGAVSLTPATPAIPAAQGPAASTGGAVKVLAARANKHKRGGRG